MDDEIERFARESLRARRRMFDKLSAAMVLAGGGMAFLATRMTDLGHFVGTAIGAATLVGAAVILFVAGRSPRA